MLLAVTIGNTTIRFGVFNDNQLVTNWWLPTSTKATVGSYTDQFQADLAAQKLAAYDIQDVIVGSVVPALTATFLKLLETLFAVRPVVVPSDTRLPMQLMIDDPKEVGADIIANVAATHALYKGPALVIDLGTATTFSVVTKNGDFAGMVIAPGLTAMSKSLTQSGALLPEIAITAPKSLIGTNTVDCMTSGLFYGYIGIVEGTLNRIKSEAAWKAAKVIATGGMVGMFVSKITGIDVVNPNLTLEGLRILYTCNQMSKP